MGYTDELLYKVAKMHYIDDLTQADISKQLNLSKPKVSRLISRAKEEGIISISINCPHDDDTDYLKQQLQGVLGIENILVVQSISDSESENMRAMASSAAKYFLDFIQDGDNIGVSWGYTLVEIAKALPVCSLQRSSIVQIAGNLDNADSTNYANEIVRLFGEKLCIDKKTTLPCPVLVENPIIVDLLQHDSKISSIMEQINTVDVAFVNIGMLSESNCLCQTGFISQKDLLYLKSKNSVGCVCSRFIDLNGNIADEGFNSRTISITPPTLQKARTTFACITSERKIPILYAAVEGKLVNTIAIDSNTAKQLISYKKGN